MTWPFDKEIAPSRGPCVWCEAAGTTHDHIIPSWVFRALPDYLTCNLPREKKLACAACNTHKGGMPPAVFESYLPLKPGDGARLRREHREWNTIQMHIQRGRAPTWLLTWVQQQMAVPVYRRVAGEEVTAVSPIIRKVYYPYAYTAKRFREECVAKLGDFWPVSGA